MASTKDFSPFVPFDLYDFFGYLFPGILFMTNSLIFLDEIDSSFFKKYIQILFYSNNSNSLSFIGNLSFIIALIVILYTLGHFIATLSHIIIDRVLIDGVEGYPINFLLDIPRETRLYSEATFKYLFTLFNLLFLIPLLPLSNGHIQSGIIIILVLIFTLIFLRIIIMLVHIYIKKETVQKAGEMVIFKIFYYPSMIILDNFIGFLRRLLGIDRKFPESFILKYKELFSQRFAELSSNDVGSENYWLSAFHVTNNSTTHQRTLLTWLHLYGFSRNACAAFYLSGILIIGHILFHPCSLTTVNKFHIGILWSLSLMLGLRYWILYSHYYSKAVIRTFFELITNNNNA